MFSLRFMNQTQTDGMEMPEGELSSRMQMGDHPMRASQAPTLPGSGMEYTRLSVEGQSDDHCLQCRGGRPVRFRGRQIAGLSGWSSNSDLWHEINLYRRDDEAFP